MKERKVKKLLRRIIENDILSKFENHFTFEKKHVNVYKRWGNCVLWIKEQPNVKIGITNITINREKNNKDVVFYVAPRYSPDKFAPAYCKEYNTVKGIDNIENFLYVLHQCCNDFVEMMIYPEETEDEFWETYYDAKHAEEENNYTKSGLDSDEFHNITMKLKNFIKNIDYDKIDILILRMGHSPFFRKIGTVYFYPNWKKCDDKFLEDFEKQIADCGLNSFQWRPFNIQKKRKRDRKEWMIYTKEGERSLFKYLKEKSV